MFQKKINNFANRTPVIGGDSTHSSIFRQTGISYGSGGFDRGSEWGEGMGGVGVPRGIAFR
jgi:hypothetical protein